MLGRAEQRPGLLAMDNVVRDGQEYLSKDVPVRARSWQKRHRSLTYLSCSAGFHVDRTLSIESSSPTACVGLRACSICRAGTGGGTATRTHAHAWPPPVTSSAARIASRWGRSPSRSCARDADGARSRVAGNPSDTCRTTASRRWTRRYGDDGRTGPDRDVESSP